MGLICECDLYVKIYGSYQTFFIEMSENIVGAADNFFSDVTMADSWWQCESLFVCLSPSVCLSVCLSGSVSVCLSVSFCLSVCQKIYRNLGSSCCTDLCIVLLVVGDSTDSSDIGWLLQKFDWLRRLQRK